MAQIDQSSRSGLSYERDRSGWDSARDRRVRGRPWLAEQRTTIVHVIFTTLEYLLLAGVLVQALQRQRRSHGASIAIVLEGFDWTSVMISTMSGDGCLSVPSS